jgi:hypothetical protein
VSSDVIGSLLSSVHGAEGDGREGRMAAAFEPLQGQEQVQL